MRCGSTRRMTGSMRQREAWTTFEARETEDLAADHVHSLICTQRSRETAPKTSNVKPIMNRTAVIEIVVLTQYLTGEHMPFLHEYLQIALLLPVYSVLQAIISNWPSTCQAVSRLTGW